MAGDARQSFAEQARDLVRRRRDRRMVDVHAPCACFHARGYELLDLRIGRAVPLCKRVPRRQDSPQRFGRLFLDASDVNGTLHSGEQRIVLLSSGCGTVPSVPQAGFRR